MVRPTAPEPVPLADMARRDSRPTGLGATLSGLVDRPRVGPWAARALRVPNQVPHLTVAVTRFHRGRAPAWSLNLDANPRAQIELGGQAIDVTARRTVGPEHESLWRRWLDVQPSAAAFRDLAGREIPIYVLSRVEQ